MRLLLTALLGLVLAAPALAQSGAGRIFPYPYETRDLPNGLRVVVIPTGLPDVVSLQIAVGTGSRNEVEPGKSGFAHFFEHMMFRGTENITNEEYTAIVKRMGASQNAYTSADRTVYHTTLLAEDLPEALRIEADRFQHLSYPEADFRTEALAVLGEYNKNFANPLQQLFEAQAETAFQVHPYQHTTMGFLVDIEDMPNEYAYSRQFFDRYYRPENATLLVAGDVEPAAVFALAEQYWGSWEAGFNPAPVPAEPPPSGPLFRHVSVEAATPPWVTVAFRGPAAYPTPDNPAAGDMQALDVLSQLAFSSSSPLYRRLVVEEQRADQLFASFGDQVDPGLLTIGARVKSPEDAAYVRDQIQQELARLRTTLPDAQQLAELKSRLRYGFASGLTTTESIAGAVIPVLAATRDINTLEQVYRNYDAVTPEDVRRVANTYFTDRGMVVLTLAQGDLPADAMASGSVDSRIAGATAAEATPAPTPVVVPRREGAGRSPQPAFRERIMASVSPLVNFRFLFNTGAADDPEGKEGLAELTARMVADAGSADVPYADVQRALFPMAAWMGAQVDKEMTVFNGTVHADNLDRYYDLVGGMLLDPGFRQEDFERVQQDQLNDIRVSLRANNDEELGKEVLYEMVYGADHPYGHLNLGHAESVARLTLDDVRDFYRTHYTQDRLTVGVAGNAPEAFLARMRADVAEHLPRRGAPAMAAVPAAPAPEGLRVTIVDKPETRAAAISMGFPISVTRRSPDFVALDLVRSYLGEHRSSNSYLYQRIREIRGMNYGDYAYVEYFPRGMYQFMPDPNLGRQQQIFQVWIRPVPPQNAQFAIRVAAFELDKLVRDGMTPEAFEATRDFLTKYVALLTASQTRRLGYTMDQDYYGQADYVQFYRDALASLTLEDVNRVIRENLTPQNMDLVIITPEAAALRDALVSDAPSPISYASEKPAELLQEDQTIQAFPLALDAADVRLVPVGDVFERDVF